MELLLEAMGIDSVEFQSARHSSLHPGRTARLLVGGEIAGYLGEVHPTVVERFDLLPHRVYAAELDFEILMNAATAVRRHLSMSRFPAVSHDIAVVLDEAWSNVEVEAEILRTGAPLLAEVKLFDLYLGAQIPEGKKSLAYSLTYRAPDRTLTDEEVEQLEGKVVEALAARFGAYLRGR